MQNVIQQLEAWYVSVAGILLTFSNYNCSRFVYTAACQTISKCENNQVSILQDKIEHVKSGIKKNIINWLAR